MHNRARHVAPVTYSTRGAGEYWLEAERRLIELDQWTPPAQRKAVNTQRGKSFGEYAVGWLATRRLKHRTRQGYSDLIEAKLTKLNNMPLSMLTAEAIRTWHHGLGTVTPTRNAHAYQLVRAVLNTAVTDGLLTTNPCVIRGAGVTRTKREAATPLTFAEAEKLALGVPANLKAFVLLGVWCGPRFGELAALTRADISDDGTDMVLHVRHSVTHRDVNGGTGWTCTVDTPKNHETHSVPVPPHIVSDVREHLANFVEAAPDSVLFKPPKSCHLNEKTFRRAWAPALKAIGREGFRIHDMRHTAISYAAMVASPVEVQARSGHKTAQASQRYQHQMSDRPRVIAADLSRLAGWQG
jgi:integrase